MKQILDWIETQERLAESATGEPWQVLETQIGTLCDIPEVLTSFNKTPLVRYHDAKFIASSRAAHPQALKALRVAVEALKDISEFVCMSPDCNPGSKFKCTACQSRLALEKIKGILG